MAPRTQSETRSTPRTTSGSSSSRRKRSATEKSSLFSTLSQRRWARWTLRGLTVGLALAFTFSLVVYPVRDYVAQRGRIADKQKEFDALADANEQLFNEVQRLKTPEGVRSAARSQLGYVMPGEQRVALTPLPALPTTLPDAWPYTLVTNILRVKAAHAGNADGALAPLAP